MTKKNSPKIQPDLFTKQIPKMPEGYYSGDKPNPNLRKFVEDHIKENPCDPETDDYDVPPFDRPLKSTKATAIYNMHTYWSKKPHDAIREYIKHYTKPGDLVLDPFCGSGGTALAALMEGRKAIAIDRSPAATFITKNYCTPVDVNELQEAFEALKAKVKPEIDWLYETRCDRCGGKATTAYTVYSQVFQCPRCLEKVPLFDCVEAKSKTAKGKDKKIKVCPHCHERGIAEEIKTTSEKFGAVPVLVSYLCEARCTPKRDQRLRNDPNPTKREYFETYDLGKLNEIEEKEIPYWYPTNRMMNAPEDQECWGAEWRPGRNFRTVDELFIKRGLWALSLLLQNCKYSLLSDQLLFVFQSNILNATKMQQYREAGGGFAKGTYYIPNIFIEREQRGCFLRKFNDFLSASIELIESLNSNAVRISAESSITVEAILTEAVDYIFTDPPYADKVQYGELNFIWESWLGFDTHWHDEEIIVNEVRGKTEKDWAEMMLKAMRECYRVLKPGRCISLCYHDTSEGTWALIQDIMAKSGFVVENTDSALFIDTGQKSYNQLIADKVNKRDLVINFRKPKPGELESRIIITGDEDPATFNEKALAIIRGHLEKNPGSTKDVIYDELVSRMVRAGEMEAHNFDELLEQVADEYDEYKWYLKETEAGSEESEQAVANAAAAKIEDFMVKYSDDELRKTDQQWKKLNKDKIEQEEVLNLSSEDRVELSKSEKTGRRKKLRDTIVKLEKLASERSELSRRAVHYTYISEFYFLLAPKPKITLIELLEDYFIQTDKGNWRPPETDEERASREKNRRQAARRKIKRYCDILIRGDAIPDKIKPDDATLAEWIRHCKRAGHYEQGKLLYEMGGLNLNNLSEMAMVNVEEDYQVCVRALRHG